MPIASQGCKQNTRDGLPGFRNADMKKDNVEMICNIGELAGLFQKSRNLESFLQTAVSVIAYHMNAAVCSIYLLEESSDELVLRANQGLSADSVGRVRLKTGEGLTGVALKELRPICEGHASRNPNYKYFPNTREEQYEAFLAVPITHGLRRVGVLVVQDPQPNYFNANDINALRAIAAQLASTIENANLLMSLHQARTQTPTSLAERRMDGGFIKGAGASQGVTCGRAVLIRNGNDTFFMQEELCGSCTLQQFEESLARSEEQLEHLQHDMEQRLMDVASLIFSAQLLILKDGNFSGKMRTLIQEGRDVPAAVVSVVNDYIRLFAASSNPRLQEKVQDVKDIGLRLIRNLKGTPQEGAGYEHCIIVGREILPSDILKYAAMGASGVVLVGGVGVTAHVAILARSLELPAVVLSDEQAEAIPEHAELILDANQGNVFVNPAEDIRQRYKTLCGSRLAQDAGNNGQVMDSTKTVDGVRVTLLANINLVSDLALARSFKAEGIGLYRSEFPFIIRTNFPSEEEQCPIYRRILDEMPGKEVIFRTLDIGGDKMLDYFPHRNESNPFLGLRAIRFSLRYKDVFFQQLRALLRAGVDRDLHIMFPLVASVDDFIEARELVQECCRQLAQENVPHNPAPRLGVMVELPSVVEVIDELVREVHFISIGSNDLIQYLLAVDRTNDQIADLYLPSHPAVLRCVHRIVSAACRRNIPLSICGDMATDAALIPFLLGIGIRRLSMDPHAIPGVQQRIQALDAGKAQAFASRLLACGTIREARTCLDQGV